jgi:hypothetical protein
MLKHYPTKYIHEPWMAPEQVQKACRCIVGVDYPNPMIDHYMAAEINQERMKQIYQQLSTYRDVKTPEEVAEEQHQQHMQQQQKHQQQQQQLHQQQQQRHQQKQQRHQQQLQRHQQQLQQQQHQQHQNNKTPSPHRAAGRLDPTTQDQQQQKQLMPAPLHSSQQAYAAAQQHHQYGQQQDQDHLGGVDEDQLTLLDLDSLVPSFNNYQPQVVREALIRDAMMKPPQMERQKQEMDVYHTESGFLDSSYSGSSDKK